MDFTFLHFLYYDWEWGISCHSFMKFIHVSLNFVIVVHEPLIFYVSISLVTQFFPTIAKVACCDWCIIKWCQWWVCSKKNLCLVAQHSFLLITFIYLLIITKNCLQGHSYVEINGAQKNVAFDFGAFVGDLSVEEDASRYDSSICFCILIHLRIHYMLIPVI